MNHERRLFFPFFFLLLLPLLGQGCFLLSDDMPKTSGAAGMFISPDKGDSWQAIVALPTVGGVETISQVNIFDLIEDPQDPRAIYIASRQHGMFWSYDDGKSWQRPLYEPLKMGTIQAIAIHPKDKCTIYVSTGTLVLKSSDCSRNWEEVYQESRSDTRVVSISIEPFQPYSVMLGELNGDLLQSFDAGKSWAVTHRFSGTIAKVEADQFTAGVHYVATRQSGIFRTVDGGQTWEQVKDSFESYPGALEYRRFITHPKKPGTMYWISTYGILVSYDRGDSWMPLNLITPPGSVLIYAFAINPNNDAEMYYTATQSETNHSTFYKSIDSGQTWTTKKMPSGQIPAILRVHPDQNNLVYLGFTTP